MRRNRQDVRDAHWGVLIILGVLLVGAMFGPCQDIVSPDHPTEQAP